MNIGELKDTLSRFPDHLAVVLAADDEGNDFHEASGFSWDTGFFDGPDGGQLVCLNRCTTEKERVDQHGDADFCNWRAAAVPALVMWP